MSVSTEPSETAASPGARASRPVRAFWLTMAGLMLIQVAWALVVPAFRAIDEVDHAYRADSVAHGHWNAEQRAPSDGRGDLIPVSKNLVAAAKPVCVSIGYNGPDNCRGVTDVGGGQVLVASSAARYNPVFYAVIGLPAAPLDGYQALYVMRGVAALLCAALLALAASLTQRWSTTVWPSVALIAVLTPTVTYSNSVAAPNGLELSAAALLWVCLLGLSTRPTPRLERHLLVCGTSAGVVIATARSIGPLWVALILATGLMLIGRKSVQELVARHRKLILVLVCGAALAVALGAYWTLSAQTNSPSTDSDPSPGTSWAQLPTAIPLWVLQSIGAFPLRNQAAPAASYLLFLLLWIPLAVAGLMAARRRVMVVVASLSLLVPVTATVLTYDQIGVAWQGRYGYPLAMGFFLLAGLALDRARVLERQSWRIAALATAIAAVACLVAQLGTRTVVLSKDLSPDWQVGQVWLIAGLTLAGYGLLALSLQRRPAG